MESGSRRSLITKKLATVLATAVSVKRELSFL